jgi:hypothetical protein
VVASFATSRRCTWKFWWPLQSARKRAGVAQCTGGEFQGMLRESAEFCPAYSCSDWRRLISGNTSSITESSAIALPKAVSRRSSN